MTQKTDEPELDYLKMVPPPKPGEVREIVAKAKRVQRREKSRQKARRSSAIGFSKGPVCIVHFGDLHCGSRGVDYTRIEKELQIVRDTPGMWLGFTGDLLDNFIIGRLKNIRFDAPFNVGEEWALAKWAMELAGPKLLYSVSGNHDAWTHALTGIDYFGETTKVINRNAIYDKDVVRIDIKVGKKKFRLKAQHKWRGYSQYNPTHGIEKSASFNRADPFDVGVGGHTHVGGYARWFNNGGKTGIAVQVGAAKRFDSYAEVSNFPEPNDVLGVPTIFTEDGGIITTTTVESASEYMRALYI